MKGYKVFNFDWTCRNMQYEVGKTYEMDKKPSLCNRGYHFCKVAADCFNYYTFNPDNKVAEIEALGEIAEEGDKCSTNKICIIREIPWTELLFIVNTGKGNSGLSNSGNRNSGNGNSGNRNSGNRNSGDWNSGNGNSGVFNIEDHKILLFDKPSNMTLDEWRRSDAHYLLNRIDFRPTDWICESDMTELEKKDHPEYETTGGYLKENDTSGCCMEWWNGLTMNQKCTIHNIPNFDADKFFEITGIRV